MDHQSSVRWSDLAKTSALGHLITNSPIPYWQIGGRCLPFRSLSQRSLLKWINRTCRVREDTQHEWRLPVQAAITVSWKSWVDTYLAFMLHTLSRPFLWPTAAHHAWFKHLALSPPHSFLIHSFTAAQVVGLLWKHLVPSSGSLPLLFFSGTAKLFLKLSLIAHCHFLQVFCSNISSQRGCTWPLSWVPTLVHATIPLYSLSPFPPLLFFTAVILTKHDLFPCSCVHHRLPH